MSSDARTTINGIQSNGRSYGISLRIDTQALAGDESKTYIQLDTSRVKVLTLSQDIFNPLVIGFLTYDVVKSKDQLVRMISSGYLYLTITINEESTDGIAIDKLFSKQFLIKTAKIINATFESIVYRFSFVSIDWWNFEQNLIYSTAGIQTSADEIIKNLFTESGLDWENTISNLNAYKPEIESAPYYASVPQTPPTENTTLIDYSTVTNDNLRTSSNYILAKLFLREYSDKIDTFPQIRFINYSLLDNKYFLKPLIDVNLSNNSDQVVISTLSTGINPIIKIASMSTRDKLDIYRNFSTINRYYYDYSTDTYDTYSISIDEKLKLYESFMTFDPKTVSKKYISYENNTRPIIPLNSGNQYLNTLTESDSFVLSNLYVSTLENFSSNDALELTVDGNFRRIPGNKINIIVNDIMVEGKDNGADIELLMGFAGEYVITSVTHIIGVSGFKNKLYLSRNYSTLVQ